MTDTIKKLTQVSRKSVAVLLTVLGIGLAVSVPLQDVYAQTPAAGTGDTTTGGTTAATTVDTKKAAADGVSSIGGGTGTDKNKLPKFIKDVITILLFIVGVAAVIMIIVGGIRYVTSSGDSSQTTAAKNTILYAIIGLVLAVMAFAIVNWVMGSIG